MHNNPYRIAAMSPNFASSTAVVSLLLLTLGFSQATGNAQTVTPSFVVGSGITFSSLPGPNLAPYTGNTEGDFTVTPTSGTWLQGTFYGNPAPSIIDGPINAP